MGSAKDKFLTHKGQLRDKIVRVGALEQSLGDDSQIRIHTLDYKVDQRISKEGASKQNNSSDEDRDKAEKLKKINDAIRFIKLELSDENLVKYVRPILKKPHKIRAFIYDYTKDEKI